MNRKLSDEHKKNIADSMKGNKNMLGKTFSDEHKEKISKSCKGRTPWNKNKKLDQII